MINSKYLYVGCGNHRLEGFIHADISVYKLSKIKDLSKKKIDLICDITKKIPLKDNSIKVIFSRDTLEHLKWDELNNHLIECNRILEDNGIVRITMPNLDKIIERYHKKDEDLEYAIKNSEISSLISPIHNHTDLFINRILYHDHYYLHNYDTIKRILTNCGFSEIKEVRPGETALKNLEKIFYEAEKGSENISFHIEAKKTLKPSIQRKKIFLPRNIIKKILVYLFNISLEPFDKRRPMFPNRKWFYEKYLKLKQMIFKIT